MSQQSLTIYQQAVTTDRPAEVLAKRHGFKSLAQLVESLPKGAMVLDVGAGASPFGKEVATLRADITWINFDYSYKDPAILHEVNTNVPSNLKNIAGDSTRLNSVYKPASFDVVFSYWLLPHLSIDDSKPASDTAKAIFIITKNGGLMSAGPQTSNHKLITLKSGPTLRVIKNSSETPDSYADKVVAATTLPKTTQFTQKLANEVATPFFGTTRYAKRGGKIPKVYHPKSGEYISPLSTKGVATAWRLGIALIKHAPKKPKDSK